MSEQKNSLEQDEEIALLFDNARIKLDKTDEQAKKEKKNIVKDLARDLEGKIPLETICIEIVNQLRGRVSERFIRESLEDRYKQEYRAENAKKQKKRHKAKESYENLAAANAAETGRKSKRRNLLLYIVVKDDLSKERKRFGNYLQPLLRQWKAHLILKHLRRIELMM